jgi:O-acetylhomoserine/O-acetylserine sulfhydrylase-like pyridoxal-dependent enzyme
VLSVNFAGLPDSAWHERATELTGGRGFASVPSFVIDGGIDAGRDDRLADFEAGFRAAKG